jgi:hypothetical protein
MTSMAHRIGRGLLLQSQRQRQPARTTTAAVGAALYHASSKIFTTNKSGKNWADPEARQYKFWNREADAKAAGKYSFLIEMSPESIRKEARIISLSHPDDPANAALHGDGRVGAASAPPTSSLPLGASLVGVGASVDAFDAHCRPNVVFVSPSCPHAATVLPQVLRQFRDTIEWVHVRSAGIDFVESDDLVQLCSSSDNDDADHHHKTIPVTNAKGQFSSSLAEYALLACSYFAKDIPRLMRQQQAARWEPYNVEELYVWVMYLLLFVVVHGPRRFLSPVIDSLSLRSFPCIHLRAITKRNTHDTQQTGQSHGHYRLW